MSICTEKLISRPNIITFPPNPPLGIKKVPRLSNPTPYPEYLYLSMSAFLVSLTATKYFLVQGNYHIHDSANLFYKQSKCLQV